MTITCSAPFVQLANDAALTYSISLMLIFEGPMTFIDSSLSSRPVALPMQISQECRDLTSPC